MDMQEPYGAVRIGDSNLDRTTPVSPLIYGQFLEHFHRVVYGGIYQPGHQLSNDQGFRQDVVEALRRIRVPVVRWPGGCFVSAYHWKDGIGPVREPVFDKAWRVEDSNGFGTDEFIQWCRLVGCEPYLCTNAGTGTSEEMSDWVEYCNLPTQGKWARRRIANGHERPFGVKYWSIGNENWGGHEIGAKDACEWAKLVRESAKMMLRVDPTIELSAASIQDRDWNSRLLDSSGGFLDWISVHGYWDIADNDGVLSGYEACIARSLQPEKEIDKARELLGSAGLLGKTRVAFDEWNLRGWHHPYFMDRVDFDILGFRDRNDRNSSYTMADAVFAACFLNSCIRNADLVGMANFSPVVNSRGLIGTSDAGLVLRPVYHVFDLFANHMGDLALESPVGPIPELELHDGDATVRLPVLDIAVTRRKGEDCRRTSLVNRSPDQSIDVVLLCQTPEARLLSVTSSSTDSFNDSDRPDDVRIRLSLVESMAGQARVTLPPHSVHVLIA